jgi:hypothetical protein
MILALAGDLHGKILDLYQKIGDIQQSLGARVDWVLQTGNFGVWPDPNRVDRLTQRSKDSGDFAKLYLTDHWLPNPTLFVPGAHEDHRWMHQRFTREQMLLLPNLSLLGGGYKTTIGFNDDILSVVGLGKTYSPVVYNTENGVPHEKLVCHYTRTEVQRACAQGPTDVLLTHQAPAGARFGSITSDSEGINKIAFAIRPKLLVHGGYGQSKEYLTPQTNIPAISLGKREIVIMDFQNGHFDRVL